MISLKSTLAPTRQNDLDDLFKVKSALGNFGYLPAEDAEKYPYPRQVDFNAIKMFQKDNKLDVDGVMKPDGPTVTAMNDKLEKSDGYLSQAMGATKDFIRNRDHMKEANTIGADKYFHCKANYEATKRGNTGYLTSHALSLGRELYGKVIKNDPWSDVGMDMLSNTFGRWGAKSGRSDSSKDSCALLRPESLDAKY